ncbi:MAG TPA: methyltransferase domain-containing protein [Rhizomicrobium sp.]|jgi:SAM-dependent methyltransferase
MDEKQFVTALYRAVLQREPDERGLASHVAKLRAGAAPETIAKKFMQLVAGRAQPKSKPNTFPLDLAPEMRVDLELTGKQSQELWSLVAKAWTRLGEDEPYWSVLTNSRWKIDQMSGDKAEAEFYQTGRASLVRMEQWLARNRMDVPVSGTCVEYGCGVGRCTLWLAKRFEHVVAFDISQPHLDRARARADAEGVKNIEFVLVRSENDLCWMKDAALFYSIIVLQHNPPPLMRSILDHAFQQLRPGGLAYFQVPTYGKGYQFDLKAYLDKSSERNMEMHYIPQYAIFDLALKNGMKPLEASPDGMAGKLGHGISTTFLMAKEQRTGKSGT